MTTFTYKNKQVGKIIGNKYITRRNCLHWFRKYMGLGISENLVHELIKKGVPTVVFEYFDGRRTVNYSIETEQIFAVGIYYHHPDYEPQVVIPAIEMRTT